MSTQNIVVIEVRAESALENDAETIPKVNKAITKVPDCETNIGSRSSPLAGNSWPVRLNNMTKRTPKDKNKRFAGRKAKP